MINKREYLGIMIHPKRDERLTEQGLKTLKSYYMREEEESPQQSFARAAVAFSDGDMELAQRIYRYVSKGYFMFSSPVLSNAPMPGEAPKGMPISCFLTYVPDTVEGLIEHQDEFALLSVMGGGVGGAWNDIRAVTDKSPGPIPFLKVIDAETLAWKQGSTRRGSYAAYLDISHPDITEFLEIRVPSGGDVNRKALNINNAVNISDEFMEAVKSDESWDLVCPHTSDVKETVSARELWTRVLDTRFKTGEPYINFIDRANEFLPQPLKDLGLEIHGSNLCNEIHLPTSVDRTAVCCLSSVNLEKFDDWKDTTMVRDLITMLDNVLDYFIEHAPEGLEKARYSASQTRDLGLGAMGFHGYLQDRDIPFESALAVSANRKMFKHMKGEADEQTKILGQLRGGYLDNPDGGIRNAHLLAVAPNASSSTICGCSPSIEPVKSNAFTHKTRSGSFLVKNKALEKVLEEKRLKLGHELSWIDEQWNRIINNEGSVQKLLCLTDWEKDVFKTAFELDQNWVIEHAGHRQEFICQGQSVNVFFPFGAERSYVNQVHLNAFAKGLKGLYYLRTSAGKAADSVGTKVERVALIDGGDCLACEG